MSNKTPEIWIRRWSCQECGELMNSYFEGHNEICECPNCGFTVIRKRY